MIYLWWSGYVLLALLCLWAGTRLRLRPWGRGLVVVAGLGLVVLWSQWVYDRAWICEAVPCSYGFLLFNPIPWIEAFVLGVAIAGRPVQWWRWVAYGALVLLLDLYFHYPLLGVRPPCRDEREGLATLQTTDYTCSPAAASTLLRLHGITRSEREMAAACMTTAYGTTVSQLYHGLRVECDARGKQVRVVQRTLADLAQLPTPAILLVCLRPAVAARDPRYATQWGWQINVPHAVVLFSTTPGRSLMVDPKFGTEEWSPEVMADLWTGAALWIE
jgi:hypothetical protein